jgi:hypothetical protein
MNSKTFTLTRDEAKDVKRLIERIKRGEKGVPHEVVRQEMLDDMAVELRRLARSYKRTGRGAKDLLNKLAIAQGEGVDTKVITKILGDLGQRGTKRQAA